MTRCGFCARTGTRLAEHPIAGFACKPCADRDTETEARAMARQAYLDMLTPAELEAEAFDGLKEIDPLWSGKFYGPELKARRQ